MIIIKIIYNELAQFQIAVQPKTCLGLSPQCLDANDSFQMGRDGKEAREDRGLAGVLLTLPTPRPPGRTTVLRPGAVWSCSPLLDSMGVPQLWPPECDNTCLCL